MASPRPPGRARAGRRAELRVRPQPRGGSEPPEGIPVRTTLDNSTTVQYAGDLHQLTMKPRSTVRDIDPQNDLTFLRITSKKHKILVAPDKDYLPIIIQNPCK
ncbi:dynein light chain roadblock-type 2 [Opisthocomus hoazin]|uniref:dynein light chain roadblock-type 2 n=1 Tax=Opisthocomus hoazin TaxID=30419 RepID=UPI003F52C2EA